MSWRQELMNSIRGYLKIKAKEPLSPEVAEIRANFEKAMIRGDVKALAEIRAADEHTYAALHDTFKAKPTLGINPFSWVRWLWSKGRAGQFGAAVVGLAVLPAIPAMLANTGLLGAQVKQREGMVDAHYDRLPQTWGNAFDRYIDKGKAFFSYPSSVTSQGDAQNIPTGIDLNGIDQNSNEGIKRMVSQAYATNSNFIVNPNDPVAVAAEKQNQLTSFLTASLKAQGQQVTVAFTQAINNETRIRQQLFDLTNDIRTLRDGYRPSPQEIKKYPIIEGALNSFSDDDPELKINPYDSLQVQLSRISAIQKNVEAIKAGHISATAEIINGEQYSRALHDVLDSQNSARTAMQLALHDKGYNTNSAIQIQAVDPVAAIDMQGGLPLPQNWNPIKVNPPRGYLSVQENNELSVPLSKPGQSLPVGDKKIVPFVYAHGGGAAWTTNSQGQKVVAVEIEGKTKYNLKITYGFISVDDYNKIPNVPALGAAYVAPSVSQTDSSQNGQQQAAAAPVTGPAASGGSGGGAGGGQGGGRPGPTQIADKGTGTRTSSPQVAASGGQNRGFSLTDLVVPPASAETFPHAKTPTPPTSVAVSYGGNPLLTLAAIGGAIYVGSKANKFVDKRVLTDVVGDAEKGILKKVKTAGRRNALVGLFVAAAVGLTTLATTGSAHAAVMDAAQTTSSGTAALDIWHGNFAGALGEAGSVAASVGGAIAARFATAAAVSGVCALAGCETGPFDIIPAALGFVGGLVAPEAASAGVSWLKNAVGLGTPARPAQAAQGARSSLHA